MFQTLHLMFEQHYTELWAAVDLIAERIRSLGSFSPGTYLEFSELSSIKETKGPRAAEVMIRELIEGHQAVIRTARDIFPASEKVGDQVTLDIDPAHAGSRKDGLDAAKPFAIVINA